MRDNPLSILSSATITGNSEYDQKIPKSQAADKSVTS